MKSFRPLIIGLPLLLAGCSTLSDLSWSSFFPFHWFGESRKVSDQGVGDITAATPMTPSKAPGASRSVRRLTLFIRKPMVPATRAAARIARRWYVRPRKAATSVTYLRASGTVLNR